MAAVWLTVCLMHQKLSLGLPYRSFLNERGHINMGLTMAVCLNERITSLWGNLYVGED